MLGSVVAPPRSASALPPAKKLQPPSSLRPPTPAPALSDVRDTHETLFPLFSFFFFSLLVLISREPAQGRVPHPTRRRGQLPGAETGRRSTEREREAHWDTEGGRKPTPALETVILKKKRKQEREREREIVSVFCRTGADIQIKSRGLQKQVCSHNVRSCINSSVDEMTSLPNNRSSITFSWRLASCAFIFSSTAVIMVCVCARVCVPTLHWYFSKSGVLANSASFFFHTRKRTETRCRMCRMEVRHLSFLI